MSRVDRMMIQGIRSFGPEERDKQVINFFTPLTLILGPNGTGKTTIIECLKYVTTGEFPPGAKREGAFVHDPKIAHESEVKGQVKLAFRDVRGKVCCVTRSMSCTQKNKSQSLKTLENAIKRTDANGEVHSLSSKCADIDREMIASLGVSKAVLENVIFCHQEESNWPLWEGKSVKTRFDDIFASTRYVKALETIKKLKKEQKEKIKVNQTNLRHLKSHKDRATELERRLDELQTKFQAAADSLTKIAQQIAPVEEQLSEIENRSKDIFKLQTQIDKCHSEQTEMERTRDDMVQKLGTEFVGSTVELREALDDFLMKTTEQKSELRRNEMKMERLNDELNKVQTQRTQLLTDHGKLQQQAKIHADNIEKRDEMIRSYAQHYHFSGFTKIDDDSVERFMDELRAKKDSYIQETRKLRSEFEEKISVVETEINDLRDKKSRLEQTQSMKKAQITQHKSEIQSLTAELQRVEASAGNLDSVKRDLVLKSSQMEDAEKEVDLEQLKTEVRTLQTERTVLDRQVKDLDSELTQLHEESEVRTKLDMLRKDKSAKEDQIKRMRRNHEDSFQHLFGDIPDSGFRNKMDDYIQQIGRNIQTEQNKLQKARTKLSQLETQCKMTRDQLKGKEDELKMYDDQLYDMCGSQNFTDGLTKMQDKMKTLTSEKGPLEATKYIYDRYIGHLKKRDPCCPLCKREFDEQSEVEELVEELTRQLSQLPSKLESKEKELKDCTLKYEQMVQMKPKMEQRDSLDEKEIPELKEKVKSLSGQIEQIGNEVSTIESGVTLMQSDESLARNIQPDTVMLDRYLTEVRTLDRDIVKHESRIGGGDSGRNIESVRNDKAEKQMRLDQASHQLDYKRDKINRQTERIHDLRQSVNDLIAEKLQIETDLQKRIKLDEQKQTLTELCLNLEDEVQLAFNEARPLDQQIEQVHAQRKKLDLEKDAAVDQVKKLKDKLKEHGSSIVTIQEAISRYVDEKRDEKLTVCQEKLGGLDQSQARMKREQDDVTRLIDCIKDDLANQQVRERELEDNLKLRDKREQIASLTRKITELKRELGGFDVLNLDKQRRELLDKVDKLKEEKHTVEGRQRGTRDQITSVQADLRTDDYKDASSKYQEELINVKTMEIANTDLEKYYQALDWAIMRYHALKMKEINEIMRELWRNTYRGNDIDTIEIRSEEDAEAATRIRRTYHYRVVMIKGDAVIDMRNRCSAGQKVLASLIIRLALAETFCHKCGILALDEPTTNLDRANIESLAFALVEIIKSREAQKNFQLVVITHDEDFVELLGSSDHVDHFWRIGRTLDGKSIIKKEEIGAVRK